MKKILALLLSGVLLASSVPAYTNATEVATKTSIAIGEPTKGSQTEPTTAGLEAAIFAVKEKITVPEGYSEFNYYFNDASSYSDAYWNLTWRNPETNAYIQINCDGDYHITYFYKYDYSNKTTGVAKYLSSELRTNAEAFLSKIAPEIKSKLEYLDVNYEGVYSGNYVYSYQRINNGIKFPDNTVTVWVNSITGEVTAASVNWLYSNNLPSAKVKITKAEAIKLLKEKMKMKLVYRSNYYTFYDKIGSSSTTEKKAYLVYEPTLNYISVNANTGEVYLTKSEWIDTGLYGGNAKADATTEEASDRAGVQTLTEEETAKIEELKKLITKSKAIDIVTSNKYLYLDKNLKSYKASLSKSEDASGKSIYVWNVNLSDTREINYEKDTDYYRAYAYATVDAQTGKILSFYSSMKSYYNEATKTWDKVKMVYDKNESRTILEKFLKAQVKDHFDNSVLSTQNEDYVIYYNKDETPVYGGYSYQYNRVNEGIEYPNNNINGSVDGVTGKIYSFSSYWEDNIVFESTKGVITADQAMDYYLGNDGFGLKYEINVINKYNTSYSLTDSFYDYADAYSVDYEIRLVYRPDVVPAIISPFTGEQLNYNGDVLTEKVPYSYKDIAITSANRNILILAEMNVGFEGENFLPEKAVTIGELNKLLQDIGYGYNYSAENDPYAENLITKEKLAMIFIEKLGLDKVSKLSGIYSTGYADEKNIGADYVGAVALVKGLGIMNADADNKFYPSNNITRAEVVDYIFNFITKSQEGVVYY